MKALIVTDEDCRTDGYRALGRLTAELLAEKGFETQVREVGRGLRPCMGCFGCWVKTPGECVIRDGMAELDRRYMNSDAVVFLSPVVFGQFSANIKNAVDRTLPNMLPFFCRRPDGSTMHPPRYQKYPALFLIGYGEGLDPEEIRLFRDITEKHRFGVGVEVYQGAADKAKVKALFDALGAGGDARNGKEQSL